MTSGYLAVDFIFIGPMPFLVPTLDNADPLFTPVITSGFDLHPVGVMDQDPASGSLLSGLIQLMYHHHTV